MKHIDLGRQAPISNAMIQHSLATQIEAAKKAQTHLATQPRGARVALLEAYALALKNQRVELATIVSDDAKKTLKDAQAEVDASIDVIHKIIRETTLADLGDMQRERRRVPVGIVGLITSFNFPVVVAHWTMVPALLAGNAVLWKPSEKTPLAARACKKIFDSAASENADLLHIVEGGRDAGAALVADEAVDMISATGSVAMGVAIEKTLANKKNNAVPPILELGGNNGVILGTMMSDAHLEFAIAAILTSFLGTTGQRCTNTRRLFVPRAWLEKTIAGFSAKLKDFIDSGAILDAENAYGYRELIDADAAARMQAAKAQAENEGGKILFGGAGEPALAIMPAQTAIMHSETFAPLLYIAPYDGGIENAMALVNAPDNAGLVNGIYTLSHDEAEFFAANNEAGHSVINSPKGTGTPANGMGFGGNKASGCGEILWSADPLAAFTRPGAAQRIAINKNIPLS